MPVRRLTLLSAAVLLAAVLAGCGGSWSGAAREADEHAENAAYAMVRVVDEVPANDAAWQVVGQIRDVTIEALALQGTSWDGAVTLRITVDREASGWDAAERSVRCYRYVFDRSPPGDSYHEVRCPAGDPIVLSEPPHPDLSSVGAAALAARLSALAPAARTPDAVQQVLTAVYPPPVGTGVYAGPGGMTVGASFHGACLTGVVPPDGPATVTSLPRLTCRGG